jgi:hypothetical protein
VDDSGASGAPAVELLRAPTPATSSSCFCSGPPPDPQRGVATSPLRVHKRRAPSGVEEAAGVEQSVREPRGERRSGWAADPPGMREQGRLASFCSSRCSDCWSRYSSSIICKTRLQRGLQKLLETVLLASSQNKCNSKIRNLSHKECNFDKPTTKDNRL